MTHGLIFHYFHDDKIKETQGSIDGNTFEKIIDKYSVDHNILNAQEYLEKAVTESLQEKDVCITFDDGLYSQFCVADKILQKKGLTAFYFVYTSPMDGVLEKMELYRTYRNKYASMDEFYNDFFNLLIEYGNKKNLDYKSVIASEEARRYFIQYDYYSQNDRIFRYLRNEILGNQYDIVMDLLMKKNNFDALNECKSIWIGQTQLAEMEERGNVIGLHSHTHFTSLKGLSYDRKLDEYSNNKKHLESILKDKVRSASYPCDTYDQESDDILSSLGIEIAFLAHYEETERLQLRKIPRIDASAFLKQI